MEFSGPGVSPEDQKTSREFPLINRRDLIRAALYTGAAAAFAPAISLAQAIESGLTPAARGEDGSKLLSDPDWKAVFFNAHQNETVIALGEVIIPSTDSPGAKEARVNRFLDLLLSVQPAEYQRQFVDALTFIDAESQRQFTKDFRDLSADDQVWLLTPWAYPADNDRWVEEDAKIDPRQQHFSRLKTLIVDAYYGSEVGQKELGWDGEFTHGPYRGCEHPAGTHT
jgi:hypothetical protein